MRKTPRDVPDIKRCDCPFWKRCRNQACFDNDKNAIMINGRSARSFNKVVDLINHETTHWTLELFLTRAEINKMTDAIPERLDEYNKYLPEKISNEIESMVRMRRYAANKKRKD
jgi:hypothetical protein